MAGHSKWANIQHRKQAQDAKRGKNFTKLIREITVSARAGGPDPQANPRLRTALDKAQAANMARDTITRAIRRGAGTEDDEVLFEVRYEGYVPGGIAVMVDCHTDNRNRTVGAVRHAFTKAGGQLSTEGAVSYLFERKAQFLFESDSVTEAHLLNAALEGGADDVRTHASGIMEVVAAPEAWDTLRQAWTDHDLTPASQNITWLPLNPVPLLQDETRGALERLLERLDDLDDVHAVYTNTDDPAC